MYYLRIKRIDEDLKLVLVGMYHANTHKWVKWVKINETTIQLLTGAEIYFNIVNGEAVPCKP